MTTWKQENFIARPRSSSAKLSDLFSSDGMIESEDEFSTQTVSMNSSPYHNSNPSSAYGLSSPYNLSPLNPTFASPFNKSPWAHDLTLVSSDMDISSTGLIGSLVRKEGHVYSLATSGDLLFTGSESKNIRVWKGNREFSGFKSSSGFVKAIVIAGEQIFTGHQDGKIRIWKASSKNPSVYNRLGTLPKLQDFLKSSIKPSNYVQVRRRKCGVWLRHFDAVSCLSYHEEAGILYSGSWDKTVKVWRISDSKCLESIKAHDDAVNSVATAGFAGLVFSGSADGTLKVWKREVASNDDGIIKTKHVLVQTLLKQECAVTSVAVSSPAGVVYGGCSDGTVLRWSCITGRRFIHGGALRGHRSAVLSVAVAGNLIASGGADNIVNIWVRSYDGDHRKLASLTGHEGPVKCLSIEEVVGQNETKYVVYSGSLDNSVKIWMVSNYDVDRVSYSWMVNGLTERNSTRFSDEYCRDKRGMLVQDVRG